MKRYCIKVYGKVQGVFFRYNTKKLADKLNLKGVVYNKNEHVEIIIEGDENKINELVKWCKQGPELAKVEKLEIKKEKYKNEFKDFIIKYEL